MASGAVGGSQGLCAAARVAPDGRGGQSCPRPFKRQPKPLHASAHSSPGVTARTALGPALLPTTPPPRAPLAPATACLQRPSRPPDLTRPRAGLRDAQTAVSVRVSAGLAEYGAPRPGGHRTTGQDPDRAKGQKTCERGRGLPCADTDMPGSRPLHPAGRTRSPGPRAPSAARGLPLALGRPWAPQALSSAEARPLTVHPSASAHSARFRVSGGPRPTDAFARVLPSEGGFPGPLPPAPFPRPPSFLWHTSPHNGGTPRQQGLVAATCPDGRRAPVPGSRSANIRRAREACRALTQVSSG